MSWALDWTATALDLGGLSHTFLTANRYTRVSKLLGRLGRPFYEKGCTMAELESQPLSAEERAELEELRAEKARREAQEEARREREELAALRAEREKAEEAAAKVASEPAPAPAPKPAAAMPAPIAPKPQPKKAAHPKTAEPKPSRDEMTFAQRMVTSKEPTGENEIPGMAPAQKIIIVLALIAFIVFMVYTITGSMGLY